MISKAPVHDANNALPDKTTAQQHELAGLRHDLAALQDMLTGMVLTDLDGINPALVPSTRVCL